MVLEIYSAVSQIRLTGEAMSEQGSSLCQPLAEEVLRDIGV